jgi:sulfur-oxidizing protein SoxY
MAATSLRRTSFRSAFLAALLAGMVGAASSAVAESAKDPWPDLARDVFDSRPLADGSALLSVDMPYRAEDAAIVPVTLRAKLPAGDGRSIKAITLVIDENPAPVAATFTVGPNAGVATIATRVRVNAYSNVHAVAELSDGSLHVVSTYVKASGGCSAPAAIKNAEEARRGLGQLRFRQFTVADPAPVSRVREAQIMIRHPNNSGLQMDQVTRLYTPAFFVQTIKVWQGDELVLAMEGGISISEDPNIRFTYVPNGAKTFRVEARDTDAQVFRGEWPAEASAM